VDALLDPGLHAERSGRSDFGAAVQQTLGEARSHEEILDRVRLFVAERRFLISVALIEGALSGVEAGRGFSDLAETVAQALFEATRKEFERQHGRVPGGRAAVLAFGRLGSREMTAGSDLDLIVIYHHDEAASASDGRRPLPPSQYYIRLTQRFIAALSAPTAEGVAYSVDLRLRPSGRAGPLATHLESFRRYHMNEARTWEHMAMSRGRPIAGDKALKKEVLQALDEISSMPRDRAKLAADVAAMRLRIEREKGAPRGFDVKTARGGLIDCEFAAQFVVLSGLARVAGETTLETIKRAADQGKVAAAESRQLALSTALQSAMLQIDRAADPGVLSGDDPPEALKRLAVSAASRVLHELGPGKGARPEISSFEELHGRLLDIQEQTRAALERVLGLSIA
jgi:glutamate-ammonia-ligase adenylyltransferase